MTPCQKLYLQEGTARRIESMQQSSATQSLHLWFLGVVEDRCILSILLADSQCLLVSTVFGMVSSLHPTIFNDSYTCKYVMYMYIDVMYRRAPKFKEEIVCTDWLLTTKILPATCMHSAYCKPVSTKIICGK